MKSQKGFTLLEILLVIGIIAVLAGIVIIAINPSKQLAQVRNSQRKSDIKQLYNAITQYYIDNSAFPSTISTTTLTEVCNTGAVSNTATSTNGVNCATAGLANLSTLVPTYLVSIPTDPTGSSSVLSFIPTAYAATAATGTGYKVGVNTAKQVLTWAPLAELNTVVTVGNVLVPVAGLNISGLVAHYLMNDTNGTTLVDSKGSNNGTGVYATSTGRVDGSATFNGTNGVNFSNISISSSTTYSAWVKTSKGSGEQYVVYSLGGGINLEINNGYAVMFSFISYLHRVTGTTFIANGNWHLITGQIFTDGTIKIWVDGNLEKTESDSPIGTYTGDLRLGSHPSGYGIVGSVDDVRIYNRALSTGEILQIYNSAAGTEAE